MKLFCITLRGKFSKIFSKLNTHTPIWYHCWTFFFSLSSSKALSSIFFSSYHEGKAIEAKMILSLPNITHDMAKTFHFSTSHTVYSLNTKLFSSTLILFSFLFTRIYSWMLLLLFRIVCFMSLSLRWKIDSFD